MLYKREGSKKYWYSFTRNGRRYQGSTGLTSKEAAEDWEAGRKVQIANREVGLKDRQRFTVDQLLDKLNARWQREHKCSRQNLCVLKKTRKDWGAKLADEVIKEHIESYMTRCQNQGYADASANRVLQVLRTSFRDADIIWPKVKLLSEDNICGQYIAPDQWKKILSALPDDGLRDFAAWCYLTGQRKGEAEKLEWSMCPDQRANLFIPASITKKRKYRNIPIEGDLARMIEKRWARRHIVVNDVTTTRESKYIFHRTDGELVGCFKKSWKTACRAAGVTRRFHDLRVTFATDGRKAGISETDLMALGGWSTRSVFDRYNLVDEGDIRTTREKLAQYRANG